MSHPIQEGDMARYQHAGSTLWECCTVRQMPGLTGLYLGIGSFVPVAIDDKTLVTAIERLVPVSEKAAAVAKLREFCRQVIIRYQLEVEGLQDLAEEHGLLKPVAVTESCGTKDKRCYCEDYGFPATCYRMTDLLEDTDG